MPRQQQQNTGPKKINEIRREALQEQLAKAGNNGRRVQESLKLMQKLVPDDDTMGAFGAAGQFGDEPGYPGHAGRGRRVTPGRGVPSMPGNFQGMTRGDPMMPPSLRGTTGGVGGSGAGTGSAGSSNGSSGGRDGSSAASRSGRGGRGGRGSRRGLQPVPPPQAPPLLPEHGEVSLRPQSGMISSEAGAAAGAEPPSSLSSSAVAAGGSAHRAAGPIGGVVVASKKPKEKGKSKKLSPEELDRLAADALADFATDGDVDKAVKTIKGLRAPEAMVVEKLLAAGISCDKTVALAAGLVDAGRLTSDAFVQVCSHVALLTSHHVFWPHGDNPQSHGRWPCACWKPANYRMTWWQHVLDTR